LRSRLRALLSAAAAAATTLENSGAVSEERRNGGQATDSGPAASPSLAPDAAAAALRQAIQGVESVLGDGALDRHSNHRKRTASAGSETAGGKREVVPAKHHRVKASAPAAAAVQLPVVETVVPDPVDVNAHHNIWPAPAPPGADMNSGWSQPIQATGWVWVPRPVSQEQQPIYAHRASDFDSVSLYADAVLRAANVEPPLPSMSWVSGPPSM
jgi:hypothetical protein